VLIRLDDIIMDICSLFIKIKIIKIIS